MPLGPADYSDGSHTTRCLEHWVDEIAGRIYERRERMLGEHVQKPPQHIVERQVEAPHDGATQEPVGQAQKSSDDSPAPGAHQR